MEQLATPIRQQTREPLTSILRVHSSIPKDSEKGSSNEATTKRRRPIRFGGTITMNYSTFPDDTQSTRTSTTTTTMISTTPKPRLRTRSTSHDQLTRSNNQRRADLRRSASEYTYNSRRFTHKRYSKSSNSSSIITHSTSSYPKSLRSQQMFVQRESKVDTELNHVLDFIGNITKATWQVLRTVPHCFSHIPQFTMDLLRQLIPALRRSPYPAIQAR